VLILRNVRYILVFQLLVCLACSAFAQVKNPFDIQRSEGDSTEEGILIENAATDLNTKLDDENPFSVSHIPIRKNQYKEIERMALPRDQEEKTISLVYLPLWIIILSMCILAYLLFIKRDHMAVLLKSILNDNFMKLSNYEENGGRNLVYMMGYVLFLLNFALLFYLLSTKLFEYDREYLYLILLLITIGFFWGKHIISALGSWIFRLSKEARLYDFTLISIYNILGVILLVANILMVFGPQSWVRALGFVSLAIFIIGLLSRHYKTLRIGQVQLNNYFFHFFLYFCAFEIAPWVIVYKVVKDLI